MKFGRISENIQNAQILENGPAVTKSTIHVVFSNLAAGNLKTALRDAGREDHVVCYF